MPNLNQHAPLRFITAGSVDDGKSTLIGRLLYDSKALLGDQLRQIEAAGSAPDFSALTDGLEAEREQGITIDVAYRYFSTARRKYIIADTPGHEQYTRNMVTGASTAHAAVLLLDGGQRIRRGLGDLSPQLRFQIEQRRSFHQREEPRGLIPSELRDMTFDVGQGRDQAARIHLSHSWAPPVWIVLR